MNGPQRIQQKRRVVKIDQKKPIKQSKCCKGEGGIGKKKSRTFKCENCEEIKPIRHNTYKDRFCSQDCMKQFSINRWLNCSICLSKCGLGPTQAARQLRIISKTRVLRQWQNLKIDTSRTKTLEIKSNLITKNRKTLELWNKYKKAWMDEVRQVSNMPDWSSVFTDQQKKEKQRQRSRQAYHKLTKEQRLLKGRIHSQKHREKIKKRLRDWKKQKNKTDAYYRAIASMRVRLCRLAKGKTKTTMDLVGCTHSAFKSHLEKMFQPGMTWENYGEWHIDHIMPVSAFDHSKPHQVKQCWHFTNLKPLWADENMQKSNKITNPQLVLAIS